jgi:hypothetical protein
MNKYTRRIKKIEYPGIFAGGQSKTYVVVSCNFYFFNCAVVADILTHLANAPDLSHFFLCL